MGNSEIALLAIRYRAVYDLNLNRYVRVNKIICWKDELMIAGFMVRYKVSEHEKTWRLTADKVLEQNNTLLRCFEQYLDKISKEERE